MPEHMFPLRKFKMEHWTQKQTHKQVSWNKAGPEMKIDDIIGKRNVRMMITIRSADFDTCITHVIVLFQC